MLSWGRRTLVSLALCALLSLTFATAAALACPGGGGESSDGVAILTPTSKTFARVNDTQTFLFLYYEAPSDDPNPREVRLRILPSEHFAISEWGDCLERGGRSRRLSAGESCRFVVQATRAGGRARLTGELTNGVNDISELIS